MTTLLISPLAAFVADYYTQQIPDLDSIMQAVWKLRLGEAVQVAINELAWEGDCFTVWRKPIFNLKDPMVQACGQFLDPMAAFASLPEGVKIRVFADYAVLVGADGVPDVQLYPTEDS